MSGAPRAFWGIGRGASVQINHFKLTVQSDGGFATLTQDNTWRRGVVCFDPLLAGRPHTVVFQLIDAGGACAATVPEEVVNLDDLALVTDPARIATIDPERHRARDLGACERERDLAPVEGGGLGEPAAVAGLRGQRFDDAVGGSSDLDRVLDGVHGELSFRRDVARRRGVRTTIGKYAKQSLVSQVP